MLDVILIIVILTTAVAAFNYQARQDIKKRRQIRDRERIESLKRTTGDSRTIDLIGEEAYNEMTKRIQAILDRHSEHKSINIELTCGPDTVEGAHELHRLLPGQPLQLIGCSEAGTEMIDVYYNGSRIGRLALLDALTVKEIMRYNHIRGAYVSEQNCYGIPDSCHLSLIVFYEPIEVVDTLYTAKSFVGKSHDKRKSAAATDICQN